jgi:hypothetical protein
MAAPGRQTPTLSLEWHRVLEAAIGLLLIVASVVLNFPVGGFGLCALLGLLITGLGLAGTRDGGRLGGQSHRYVDVLFVGLLIVAALVSAGLFEPVGPAITLIVAAAAQALLLGITRYVEPVRDGSARGGRTRRGRGTSSVA